MQTKWWTPYLFVSLAMLGLFVFRFAPIGAALWGSLQETSLTGEVRFAGLENYTYLFSDPTFWNSIRVTLLFNLVINPLQVVCAMVLALMLVRPGPFLGVFRASFMAPMTVSIALTAVIWGILLEPTLGPVNGFLKWLGVPPQPFFRSADQAIWSIIGIATWKGAGYWMIFLLAGLIAIPRDVLEAAEIDGAGWWSRLVFIILPLMKRPLAFVLVADTAINFLMFAPPYIITQGGPAGTTHLLMFEAYQSAFTYFDHGRAMAISVIVLAMILLIVGLELRLLRPKGAH
ncbi:carbohydrate ABC transporter permease [Propylenella binzhouense]|uniref:Sugar ABC transporter permease n=1 Tax=Propylenella binzhouense TaxID=2555902 RepID=A0A964WTX4_9HYPH|nr:sugar ABC transporter permease [Propylenella binzhouense]MYZ48454.1 sugar ABC transporter permease [Propylenella binzhouense]